MITLRTFLLATSIFATGCASYSNSSFVNQIDTHYSAGQFEQSALYIEKKLDLYEEAEQTLKPVAPNAGDVLMHLEAGENWRLSGNLERSIAHYDAVEELLKTEDTEGVGKKVAEGAGSALVNDTLRSYDPASSERILTNYYKAMSFWAQGNADFARVEFNRANERARIAVEDNADKIAEQQEEETKLDDKERSKLTSKIEEKFPSMANWAVFEDFLNPAVAYTNALFLASSSNSDISKAQDLMVRVRGMIGENPVVDDDLTNLSNYSRLTNGTPAWWIIYESGLSPTLTEKSFAIPFIWSGNLITANIALPELTPRWTGLTTNGVTLNGSAVNFSTLATMERVLQTEFKTRWPATVTRAVITATTKAVLQQQMGKELGILGNLAGLAYSAATTTADTRTWRSMPEAWHVAKLPATQLSTLRIPYGLGLFSDVELPNNTNALVYIKQPAPNAKPYIEVIQL